MKKIFKIGARTGLNVNELRKVADPCLGAAIKTYCRQVAGFGLFGLMAAALTILTGCFKTGTPAAPPSESTSRTSAQPSSATIQDLVNSIDKSTGAARTKVEDNCGPYPGYPCGTKYYTVSVSDFLGRA